MRDEFQRIRDFFAPLAMHPAALNLCDDVAVLSPPAGMDALVSKDALVAGVHFFVDDTPAQIASRLMRTALSDLAAKGGVAFGYWLALALPSSLGDEWLAAFTEALKREQGIFNCYLLGGDTVCSHQLMLSLTVLAYVPTGAVVRRQLKSPAGRVLVSGTIGDAALGLLVRRGDLQVPPEDAAYFLERFYAPKPRFDLGGVLREHALASIDISDGLMADLGHLCQLNGLAAKLYRDVVPLSKPARTLLAVRPDLWPTVLGGGDDYELCVLADDAGASALLPHFTVMGSVEVASNVGVQIFDGAGAELIFPIKGWDHFVA